MRYNKGIYILLLVLLLSGCVVTSPVGYYWGSYSKTYYTLLKDPSEKNVLAHEDNLRKIIRVSEEKNLKVAPGIQAELGYLVSKKNNNQEAIALYEKEVNLYPESKVFLERLTISNDK